MKSKTFDAPTKPAVSAYDQAIGALRAVEDDEYRAALVEALIRSHVRRQKGFDDPGGNLAMALRRAALEAA